MTDSTEQPTPMGRACPMDPIREAEAARDALRDSLAAVGVKLPTLRLDPVCCADEEPVPLVDLGRCTVATVQRLVTVLGSAAAAHRAHSS